jgi:hypothetical protein
VLALHALAEWSSERARAAHAATRGVVAADPRVRILGDVSRHASTCGRVPVLLDTPDQEPRPGIWWSKSGAQAVPCVPGDAYQAAAALLARVKLAALATAGGADISTDRRPAVRLAGGQPLRSVGGGDIGQSGAVDRDGRSVADRPERDHSRARLVRRGTGGREQLAVAHSLVFRHQGS